MLPSAGSQSLQQRPRVETPGLKNVPSATGISNHMKTLSSDLNWSWFGYSGQQRTNFALLGERECDIKYKNHAEIQGGLTLTRSKLLSFFQSQVFNFIFPKLAEEGPVTVACKTMAIGLMPKQPTFYVKIRLAKQSKYVNHHMNCLLDLTKRH